LEDGNVPSDDLRKMEIEANQIFASYCNAYYEGGISSAYFWDIEESNGFGACVVFKKDGSNQRDLEAGIWDSVHVVEVIPGKDAATYKLSTTIILSLSTKQNNLDLSGYIQRQVSRRRSFNNF
jgi:capping protein (actin filament) muscle Z-line, beta